MQSIEDREKNLFNATDTMAQFYDEIESFLDILYTSMERLGYAAKAERLRSGTFSIKNLSRRLLATANVIYVKGVGQVDEAMEEDEESEEEGVEPETIGKHEVAITTGLRIPFVHLALFEPRTIPSVRTLTSPSIRYGALGDMRFVEKKTGNPAQPDSPQVSLSALANFAMKSEHKEGDEIRVPCWRPARMKKYKMHACLVGFESQRLLEIDTQEKIRDIADKLVAMCES